MIVRLTKTPIKFQAAFSTACALTAYLTMLTDFTLFHTARTHWPRIHLYWQCCRQNLCIYHVPCSQMSHPLELLHTQMLDTGAKFGSFACVAPRPASAEVVNSSVIVIPERMNSNLRVIVTIADSFTSRVITGSKLQCNLTTSLSKHHQLTRRQFRQERFGGREPQEEPQVHRNQKKQNNQQRHYSSLLQRPA